MRTISSVTEIDKEYGGRLKHYRVQAGLSAKQVATACGINSQKTVYLWESGRIELTVNRLMFLLHLYDVSLKEFLGLENEDPYHTSDEIMLVNLYRSLNEVGKQLLLSNARVFAGEVEVVAELQPEKSSDDERLQFI